jgi:hypothetical protein
LPAEVLGQPRSLDPSGDGSSACPASSRSGEATEDGRATSWSPGRPSTQAAFGALVPLEAPPCGETRLYWWAPEGVLGQSSFGVGPRAGGRPSGEANRSGGQRAWLTKGRSTGPNLPGPRAFNSLSRWPRPPKPVREAHPRPRRARPWIIWWSSGL